MPQIQQVAIAGERYFKMTNSDSLRPFFMSIVSDANHWMFISSNGGLSAGRKNAEYALFPYYTDDKITESADITGSKSIFRLAHQGKTVVWEPFTDRYSGQFKISRNLYKSIYGNRVMFEEVNHDLNLTFRYEWSSSNRHGFVRECTMINDGDQNRSISLIDGIQNILPYGVNSELQQGSSNLVDAYKRSELDQTSGLGIFSLSAIIVDKAEPSEALKANVAWSLGLDKADHLLSSRQLDTFRESGVVKAETDVKGEKGAYFVHTTIEVAAKSEDSWLIVANVNQNHAGVARLIKQVNTDSNLQSELKEDVKQGSERLVALSAAADGMQITADSMRDTRHFSNAMFNIMRGGIFDNNYSIERADFSTYLKKANPDVFASHTALLAGLPEVLELKDLKQLTTQSDDADFRRLCLEYLPLKFSRRHGDPSRPWNRFSINTHSEVDGSKILDYEGNWRDIFQNWEALAMSYPDFIEGMIMKFLNATTFDGYNPYRVTKGGFDWETIEEDDPWSYIGYWGDHQIIYLLKFLEFIEKHQPGQLERYFDQSFFVYANVPYRIKPYEALLDNPKDTIDFDYELDAKIRELKTEKGADAALLPGANGAVYRVNFIEKILATVLAKLSNYIPEGGIWMNTQRPEWNDANNALVGNGVSMVTLYYLRRFLQFFTDLLAKTQQDNFELSAELFGFYERVAKTLETYESLLSGSINDQDRKRVLDGLGQAADDYRQNIYANSFSGDKKTVSRASLQGFLTSALAHLDHAVAANQRTDKLFHAYNLMTPTKDGVTVSYLSEMLEGQVAALSLGNLSPETVLDVLDALKSSKLYREDQNSYILYPNKDLPGFLSKNTIPQASVSQSELLQKLVTAGDANIIEKDVDGKYHFNGNFKNAGDVKKAFDGLAGTAYAAAAKQDRQLVLDIFEEVFNHKEFTGRSGTFFGYEGLGSIYWHMVSKLQLAVQECCNHAIATGAAPEVTERLIKHYYDINEGIGVHKSPKLYGAFPTDPYSHTPAGKGAQQPGMTGQVKEDFLSRMGELGAYVDQGALGFKPDLLKKGEFLSAPSAFHYVDINAQVKTIDMAANTLGFTYCQVPVIYTLGEQASIKVVFEDGDSRSFTGHTLDHSTSEELFQRSGKINQVQVHVLERELLH
jgi:hypothetical protein